MSFIKVCFVFLISLCVFPLTGCARFSNITPAEASALGADETIIVLGIPDNHRIEIGQGVDDGSKWKFRGTREVLLDYRWKDGYLVRKVSSQLFDERLGVLRISTPWRKEQFRPCKGKPTLVFKVPPKKVLYIGHVDLDTPGDKKEEKIVGYRVDLEEARLYLQKEYSEIAAQLSMAETEVKELSNISCNFFLTDFLDALGTAGVGAISF